MRQTARKTQTLYPAIPSQAGTRATCYHCGHRARAEHLLWVRQPMPPAYYALCAICAPRHAHPSRDTQGAPASALGEEDVMAVLVQAGGPGWTAMEIASALGHSATAAEMQDTLEQLVAQARLVRRGVGRGAIYHPVAPRDGW